MSFETSVQGKSNKEMSFETSVQVLSTKNQTFTHSSCQTVRGRIMISAVSMKK